MYTIFIGDWCIIRIDTEEPQRNLLLKRFSVIRRSLFSR